MSAVRHPGLLAFGVTCGVAIPAALHGLDAGSAQVGKLFAPGARSLTVGRARITAAVDRALVDPGDAVHLTLTATTARDTPVEVGVLLLEAIATSESRVDTPPRLIAHEHVSFEPGGAGAVHELTFQLRGHRGPILDGVAPFGRYTILVMSARAAANLEHLRGRAFGLDGLGDETGRVEPWSQAFAMVGRDLTDDERRPDNPELVAELERVASVIGRPGQSARLDLQTRPAPGPVRVHAPARARVAEPFAVAVTVTNPGHHAVTGLQVTLEPPPLFVDDYRGVPSDAVDIAGDAELDLGPRESRTIAFTVTARRPGTVGLYGRVRCGRAVDPDGDEPCLAVIGGQLDATDVRGPAAGARW